MEDDLYLLVEVPLNVVRRLLEVSEGYSADELQKLHELQVAVFEGTIAQLVRNCLLAHEKGHTHHLVIQVHRTDQILVALRSLLRLRVNAAHVVRLEEVYELVNGDKVRAGNLGNGVPLGDRNLARVQDVIVHHAQRVFVCFEKVTYFLFP